MKLYEINQAMEAALMDCIDPETGEITGDTEILDALQMEKAEKVKNIVLLMKNIKADNEAIHNEERTLQKRRKAGENFYNRLFEYLSKNLEVGEKYQDPQFATSWRKSESVEIDNLYAIPMQYLRAKDPEPKKDEIKKAIKAGEVVPGAVLVEKQNLQIK